jgi:uncharacterized protein YecT (DUF1311 family)
VRAALLAIALAVPASAQEFVPGPYMEVLAACYGAAGDPEARAACLGEAARICQEEEPQGQTTAGLVTCLGIEADAWDVLLNGEYRLTMDWARAQDTAERAAMPEFAVLEERLRAAQRAWNDFREEECAMRYALWGSGSMRRIAGAECQLRMIGERTLELRALREEG